MLAHHPLPGRPLVLSSALRGAFFLPALARQAIKPVRLAEEQQPSRGERSSRPRSAGKFRPCSRPTRNIGFPKAQVAKRVACPIGFERSRRATCASACPSFRRARIRASLTRRISSVLSSPASCTGISRQRRRQATGEATTIGTCKPSASKADSLSVERCGRVRVQGSAQVNRPTSIFWFKDAHTIEHVAMREAGTVLLIYVAAIVAAGWLSVFFAPPNRT